RPATSHMRPRPAAYDGGWGDQAGKCPLRPHVLSRPSLNERLRTPVVLAPSIDVAGGSALACATKAISSGWLGPATAHAGTSSKRLTASTWKSKLPHKRSGVHIYVLT